MTGHDARPTIDERRAALIEAITRRAGAPLPPAVLGAFQRVARHLFVPGVNLDAVYSDEPIVIRRDKYGMAISGSVRPSVLAVLLSAADVQPGDNILEIGTGTGYNTALLAELAGPEGRVTTLELLPDLAEAAQAHLERAGYPDVTVLAEDGAEGYAPHAPYDRIISAVSVWDIPAPWVEQLKPGGLLVAPLSFGRLQIGAALRRLPSGALESVRLFPPAFLLIQGNAAGPDRHTRVPGSSLVVDFGESPGLDEATIHVLLSADHEVAQLPLELEQRNLGLFSYYMLLKQPPGYSLITYNVEEGQLAYGLELFGWGIMRPTSACLVPYGDTRVVHIYGSSDAYLTLADQAREWEAAGRPDFDDFRLYITPAGQRHYLPPEPDALTRVFVRPAHTYTLWVRPAPRS